MSKTINSKLLVRRDSSSNWTTNNPVLSQGEIGYDTNEGKIKVGNGSSNWSSLPFFALENEDSVEAPQAESDANVILMLNQLGLTTNRSLQTGYVGTTKTGTAVASSYTGGGS